MKRCIRCDQEKGEVNFGKDKWKPDGFNPYCKECIKKRNDAERKNNPEYRKFHGKNYREKNRDKLREEAKRRFTENREEYLKKRRESYHQNKDEIAKRRKIKRQSSEAKEKARIRIKEWREKNKDKFRASVRKWQIKHRDKTNAHAKVNRAVAKGKLIRSPQCEECGLLCKTEGHHEDYSRPLDVKWLCRRCHAVKIETVKV